MREKTDSRHDMFLKSDSLIKTKTDFLSTITDVRRKIYRRRGRHVSVAQPRNVYSWMHSPAALSAGRNKAGTHMLRWPDVFQIS